MKLVYAVLAVLLTACGQQENPELVRAKQVWESNCQVCHLNGLGGAPQFGNARMWTPRLAKGEAVLVSHAINGFEGETGIMPARGGNPDLNDEDVQLAVQYMISNSQ